MWFICTGLIIKTLNQRVNEEDNFYGVHKKVWAYDTNTVSTVFRGRIICVFNLHGVYQQACADKQTLLQQAFEGELYMYALIICTRFTNMYCADDTNIASTGFRGALMCVINLYGVH